MPSSGTGSPPECSPMWAGIPPSSASASKRRVRCSVRPSPAASAAPGRGDDTAGATTSPLRRPDRLAPTAEPAARLDEQRDEHCGHECPQRDDREQRDVASEVALDDHVEQLLPAQEPELRERDADDREPDRQRDDPHAERSQRGNAACVRRRCWRRSRGASGARRPGARAARRGPRCRRRRRRSPAVMTGREREAGAGLAARPRPRHGDRPSRAAPSAPARTVAAERGVRGGCESSRVLGAAGRALERLRHQLRLRVGRAAWLTRTNASSAAAARPSSMAATPRSTPAARSSATSATTSAAAAFSTTMSRTRTGLAAEHAAGRSRRCRRRRRRRGRRGRSGRARASTGSTV